MDFYIILGLDRGATLQEIKRSYRRLSRRFHPNINPGDRAAETFFNQVSEAYETLSDPASRREYDVHGVQVRQVDSSSVEFQGFDFSTSSRGVQAATFGELFSDVFQAGNSAVVTDNPQKGADLHAEAVVTFEEAMQGVKRKITLTRLVTCSTCRGQGVRLVTETQCLHCGGRGTLRWTRGHMVFSKPCVSCDASGRQSYRNCATCGGEGVGSSREVISVSIPSGVTDGARVHVSGKGHAGRNGGEPGDLYISMRVTPHILFRRKGDDLHVVVPIAIHEAGLGAKINVPTVEGFCRLRVPPGAQSGQKFRLRSRGAPSIRSGQRGDLVVEIKLVMPRIADERSKELLREFGEINSTSVRKTFDD